LDLNVCFKCGAKETAKGWTEINFGKNWKPDNEPGGGVTIDTVRDVMCYENPSLTPEEAAFLLSTRYPEYSYQAFLKSTRIIQEIKDLLAPRQ
jgi:hypothetical protein